MKIFFKLILLKKFIFIFLSALIQSWDLTIVSLWIQTVEAPTFCCGGAWTACCSHLDVVGDERLPQLKHLQHGGCRVVRDGVTLQHILGHHHLPGQPALVECCVQRQKVRQMAWLTATKTWNDSTAYHYQRNVILTNEKSVFFPPTVWAHHL